MPRVPKCVAAPTVAVVLGTSGLLAGAPAAAQNDYPRILTVNASRPPQVEVEAVVPPLLAGETLPIEAFQVIENGRQRPVMSATRLTPADLRVLLVLDTAVEPATLAAEQGAAREFVFQLPPEADVGLVAANPEPDVVAAPGRDRSAIVRSIIGLRSTAPSGTNAATGTLELALGQLRPPRGTGVVVVVDSRPVTTAVPVALFRAATAAKATVYPIVLADPPLGYLGGLTARSGGRLLPVDDPGRLLSAFDIVVKELLGHYRVVFATNATGRHPADLTVAVRGIRGTTAFVVDSAATASPSTPASPSNAGSAGFKGSTRKSSSSSVRLLAGLLLVGLIARLGWRVAHRS